MNCRLCGSSNTAITYEGYIRDGQVGNRSYEEVKIYRCHDCGTIWHYAYDKNVEDFYESSKYRESVDGTTEIDNFYSMHDKDNWNKFNYTGIEIFRGKVIADVGCGAGAFLDYISGAASECIAIEPSKIYRQHLMKKGYMTFPYMQEALKSYREKVDVIISFDVIEHTEDPVGFVKEAYDMLKPGGCCYIGTPTECSVMRDLLGDTFDSFYFRTQHPWCFGEGSFKVIADICNINKYVCRYFQNYGLGNLVYWLINGQPGGDIQYEFISKSLDHQYRTNLEDKKLSDYIVLMFEK